ncbi:MAG: adenine phosphoribosyltransferase [Phycisphaerae bacterium]
MNLSDYIRSIPDWPKKGILFRDITPLLGCPAAFGQAIESLAEPYKNKKIDYVAAVEARGFIFGSAIAEKLGAGFVPIRKKGKLPYKTESFSYGLEYGSDTVEVHIDAIKKGGSVLMIDDLLATGGTMAAACKLIEKIDGKVEGVSFLIELADLKGREKLKEYDISVVLKY